MHGSSDKQRCCSWPVLTYHFAEALACIAACACMRGIRHPCLFWQLHAARRILLNFTRLRSHLCIKHIIAARQG